jgi:hypothetical protein
LIETAGAAQGPRLTEWRLPVQTHRIRQFHRWLSIIFVAAVLANLLALALKQQAVWVGLMALAPLILLMLTGLYLFALPYLSRRRGGQAAREGG